MENEIVGKWKDRNENIIEFRENGVVIGLTKNVKKEYVDGNYKIVNDSLKIEFLVIPEPRNLKGNLEFLILRLDEDSLVLDAGIGSLNYTRIIN